MFIPLLLSLEDHPRDDLGHTATDDAYDVMREAGAIDENPARWAEQILRLERARNLLLG